MSSASANDTQQVCDRIRKHFDLSQQASPPIEADSALSADDEFSGPYWVSETAWFSWTAAADQLEGVRIILEDARRVQATAQHTLLRSALENAATAVWLLSPKRRDTRVLRALQIAAANLHAADQLHKIEGLDVPAPGRPRADRMESIRQVALKRGLDLKLATTPPRYGTIVAESMDDSHASATLKATWMIDSGFTHGRQWASLSYLDLEDLTMGPQEKRQVQLTGNLESVTLHAATVLTMLDRAQMLLGRLRVKQY